MTTQTAPPLADRDLRQRDLLPPEALRTCRCSVVGVGAIGRQVALQLAAIGVPHLQLIDFDGVETVNLAAQGFLQADLGQPKVEAVAALCHQINPALQIETVADRFRRSLPVENIVFCCVDSMAARRLVFESVRHQARFFVDGRMNGEVIRVLAAAGDREHYPTTLFTDDESYRGSCTAKTTIFTANIAAGLMLSQFSRWLRRLPVEADLQVNLLASEMTVTGP